ncbi:cupin domain-containing protein [Caminibacter mediatlanticus TB-2]|uniref:Cupin domain-containing protein n=1 Tax=Caminibacter mediatlanticus TB-2 TaxID=391592 RepID=A0ABX5V617_9BACT|nr:cupin domain-containing protein [Caminibacter mediatlanticus]QCT93718.1 cupin domain-containing protein [Caminibacter mediatlanticus TB-2]
MRNNLFEIENLPPLDSEIFITLLEQKNIKIKKIISNTIKTPQTFIQKEDEFVVLLKGCAKIEINGEIKKLKAGDYLFIPANTPHTLLKTKKTAIWLAIHIY